MSTRHAPYYQLPLDTPALLAIDNLVELFPGTTPDTWRKLRSNGKGPAAVKAANRLYYPREAVEDWINDNYTTA